MRPAVVLVLASACRFNFFERDTAMDAPRANDADRNTELGPWGPPMLLAEVSAPADPDDDPTLTQDQLEMYFDSGRFVAGGASGDVWVATRASTSNPFGTPSVVNEFLSPSDESTGDLSPDGLSFYLGSDRQTSGDRDLYVSTRANRQSPWTPLARIAELSADSINDTGACQSADGLSLIFASERTGSGDLYLTTRATAASPWAPPTPVPGINTADEESQHWCNDDLTLIYFARRVGGQLDIFYASRATPSLPFEPAQPVPELTSTDDDADPWVSPDLRTMYFSSGSTGATDIYISKR